jgi:uncharacterized RDD family membrane protein YckC
MSSNSVGQLINFGISAAIAAVIWNYYDERKFPVSLKYSTFWPRFWSPTVDGCVLFPLGFVSSYWAGSVESAQWATSLIVAQNLIRLVYTVWMHARYGQTVGKMVCGVRVIDFKSEGRISFLQAAIRESIPIGLNLILAGYATYKLFGLRPAPHSDPQAVFRELGPVFWLGSLSMIWFLLEIVTMLTNDKRRALHDYLAGTVVVRTNLEG